MKGALGAVTFVVIGVVATVAVLAAVVLIVVYTGSYNVAATEEHASITRWAFRTTMHNSVDRRAGDVQAPESFSADMITSGASAYRAMCQPCHAGPGVERSTWGEGMRPQPPHLTEAAADWEPNEIFWLVKHGVKMTGMPAFGPTHDDQALWEIVAFVKQLPAMTPERYAALGGGEAEGHTDESRPH